MTDVVTANLPAISLLDTSGFYDTLGFKEVFRDDNWMILSRGPLTIEFFPHPTLIAKDSWFSACIRVEDVDALYSAWTSSSLPGAGIPRLTQPKDEPYGFRVFAMVDLNGSLLRCLQDLSG